MVDINVRCSGVGELVQWELSVVDINVRCSGVGELVQWELSVVDINVRWGRRAGTVGALSGRHQRKAG